MSPALTILAAVLASAASVLTITGTLWKWVFAPKFLKLTELEITCRDFMPRTQIMDAIGHEKENRATALQGMKMLLDLHSEEIVKLKVAQGISDERLGNVAKDVTDVLAALKEFSRDTAQRFDRMQDTLNGAPRRVA